jgi:formyltetrahydrofolate dehydrogenase
MVVKILGDRETAAYKAAEAIVKSLGHAVYDSTYFYCDLSIAPLLTKRLSDEELLEPMHGTLIFHPSPLPWGRGASSIRWAYRRREPITAATWFWANERLDGGDICESEIIKVDYSISPRDFYAAHIIPALERTLQRCLKGISAGYIRRVPQVDEYSSYDSRI